MTRRTTENGRRSSRARQKEAPPPWWTWLTSPAAQQALAVGLLVLSLLTLLPLLHITSGRWTDAWVHALQFVFGWGIIPVAFALGGAGILILLHHLDRPVVWRWRPIVGLELVFFGMLALTHLIVGGSDPWGLVESGWGGGLVGWAIAHLIRSLAGPWVAALLLVVILLTGVALTMDLTARDVGQWLAQALPAMQRLAPPRQRMSPPSPAAPTMARRAAAPPPTVARPPAERAPEAPVRRSPETAAPTLPRPPATAPPVERTPAAPARPAEPATIASVRAAELRCPPLDLLDEVEAPGLSDEEVRLKSRIIVETLGQFGLPVQVVEVRRGPTVTQFGVAPGFTDRPGPDGRPRQHKVRVGQISSLASDLALALAAPSLRVEAPVPGRSVVGIEVPNEEIGLVTLRAVMESERFQGLQSPLAIALGEDVAGSPVVADLSTMPHLLIAGTTGSGKSVCIKALATCLAMTNKPDALRMVMIDPKMVELVHFNGLPHVLGHTEVELERITRVLRWVAHEMDQRYKKFAAAGARHLDDYNRKNERLPRIVVLIDELADLMMLAPEETERTICRIAQMARATGIHLVVATQRPSTDVVTGLIKANFPARISFVTASQVDSRVILDMPGAETLLGRGDMLYLASDSGHPLRVQGCYVSEQEIERVVSFWRGQTPGWSGEAPWETMMPGAGREEDLPGGVSPEDRELLQQAAELVRSRRTVSASYLQRQLRVGYPTAARLMEHLERMGLVGPAEAAGRPRQVIGGEGEDRG